MVTSADEHPHVHELKVALALAKTAAHASEERTSDVKVFKLRVGVISPPVLFIDQDVNSGFNFPSGFCRALACVFGAGASSAGACLDSDTRGTDLFKCAATPSRRAGCQTGFSATDRETCLNTIPPGALDFQVPHLHGALFVQDRARKRACR